MIDPIHIDSEIFLRQHFALPALPEVIARLQANINNDDIDIDDVAQLISGDPALVAQVLKIVNSAYYGLTKNISKVRVAISFIGLNELFNIILSLLDVGLI